MTDERFQELYPVLELLDAKLLVEKGARLASDMRNLDEIDVWLTNRKLPWTIENAVQAVDALHTAGVMLWHKAPAPAPPPAPPRQEPKNLSINERRQQDKHQTDALRIEQKSNLSRQARDAEDAQYLKQTEKLINGPQTVITTPSGREMMGATNEFRQKLSEIKVYRSDNSVDGKATFAKVNAKINQKFA